MMLQVVYLPSSKDAVEVVRGYYQKKCGYPRLPGIRIIDFTQAGYS
jgi:hypothetical protein